MTIVEIIARENNSHRNQCGNCKIIPEGWAVVPDDLETPNFPFGNIEVEEIDGVMTVTQWTACPCPEPEKKSDAQISRIETKTYVGSAQETTDVTFSFKPQLFILGGVAKTVHYQSTQADEDSYTTLVVPYGMPKIHHLIDDNNTYNRSVVRMDFTYNDNTLTIKHNKHFNVTNSTYWVIAIG